MFILSNELYFLLFILSKNSPSVRLTLQNKADLTEYIMNLMCPHPHLTINND